MNELSATDLEALFAAVGDLLVERGADATILVVGGAALLLWGEVDRLTTGDVDVIASLDAGNIVFPYPLPAVLQEAVNVVAANYGLSEDWMNATVARSWSHRWPEGLPSTLLADVEWRRYGGLHVGLGGRRTLIPLKVHAVVDRARAAGFDAEGGVTRVDLSPAAAQRHLDDLAALRPTDAELEAARMWVRDQDVSPEIAVFLDAIEAHVRAARR